MVPSRLAATLRRAAAAAALLVALTAVARAADDTTGKQVEFAPGYTFGSNVAGYLHLSTDICDVKAAIGTSDRPDYAAARRIYNDGKNSRKSDGSVRTLRELGTKSYAGEPVFDEFAEHYGTAAFIDQPISFALAGDAPYVTVPQRNETIVKGLEAVLQSVYLLHELDEAADKIKAGKTSPADGAPHNVDETWAIYTGAQPTCSLWGASNRRAKEFGTMQDCSVSKVNAGMLSAHRALYRAAADGDAKAFERQRKEVQRLLTIANIQSVLKYAELMDRASASNDLPTLEADQAEGHMYWRAIAPFVAKANPEGAETIDAVLRPGAPVPPKVLSIIRPALESAYEELGVSPGEVGAFGAKQALGCATSSASPLKAAGAAALALALAAGAALV